MSKRGCTVVAGLQAVTYGLKRGKIGVEDKYFLLMSLFVSAWKKFE